MSKKIFIPMITIIMVFSCFKQSQGLKQQDMLMLINRFLSMHVQYHNIDDTISERILNNYINILDYGKYYFYKSDIDIFQKQKHLIDDYIRDDNFKIVFDIFAIYKRHFKENMLLFDTLIKKKYNFTIDEKIIIDRDKIKFPTTKKEMSERWRKTIKLQLLNYISSGKKIKEAKEKLKKKYALLEKRVNEIDSDKLLSKFMNAFSTSLDPHSNYLTRGQHEDFKISMELKLEGIGVRLRTEDGFVIVESIIAGGATDKLPKKIRLKPEDKIISVAQAKGEFTDVIDMDLRDVVKKIRGKKGTKVRLTILRKTDKSANPIRMIVPIIREEIKLQDSDAESDTYKVKRKGKNRKIGYIKLPSFYHDSQNQKSSTEDLKQHINSLINKRVSGIILDLRGNPGGLLNEAISIGGLFIDNGPIVQIKSARSRPQVINDNDNGTFYKGPLVILIDKFSASASEILAGAIKDYKRGLIIGPENTFGKGTVQNYEQLSPRLGAIKITTHIFYQPAGTSNQLYGIAPDIIIPSLSTIWDIGEDKTKYPLKWKKVSRAFFTPYNKINKRMIKSLQSSSKKRINSNKEFKELIKKINRFKKQFNNKTISLKEESSLENQKKKEIEKKLKNDIRKKTIDLKNDLFLKEAFNITSEYIDLIK